MEYIEIIFSFSENYPGNDVLPALLTEIGFESFIDNGLTNMSGYIPTSLFSETSLKELLSELPEKIDYQIVKIPDQDWNEVWEKNFTSIMIADNCIVRAPLYPAENVQFDLVINPKMSFGTAHHETTFQILQLLLQEDVKDKTVLDMGCGTAVLSILAEKMGAKKVVAIDNDEWAYRNALENIALNNLKNTTVYLGDAEMLGKENFDVILANITRNILLRDMERYCRVLNKGSLLFLSGFFVEDNDLLIAETAKYGVVFEKAVEKNGWTAMKLQKG
ncbi:MAG: 50S ribosomal protein L11 methyltransferase [Bacteroidales bacterium]|nr:50S ribosomal protein L11 methyltransferase [Bacteroidales bacterium]